MSADTRVGEFAKMWLATSGWTSELDAERLAALVEDLCLDFKMQLEEEYDRDQPH